MNESQPRVFLNSMPKAGTNLLSRAFDLAGMRYDRLGIAATLLIGKHYYLRQLLRRSMFERDPLMLGLDVQMPIRRAWLSRRLAKVPQANYVTGHANWSPALEQILAENDYAIALVIRDPLDVLVSQCHYVAKSKNHYMHSVYAKHDLSRQVDIALNGGRFEKLDVAPFTTMLHRIDAWIDRPRVSVLRFEDIVGQAGGGTVARQKAAMDTLSRLTGRTFDPEQMKAELYGQSHTFRKGKVGSASEELDEATLARAQQMLRPMRQKWGYIDD